MFRAVLVLLILVGCASSPKRTQYFSGSKEGDESLSTITSVCDDKCSALVQSKIEYFVPWVVRNVQPAILNEIDGVPGPTTVKCVDCVIKRSGIFNEPGNYGFLIKLLPGQHTLKVSQNDHMSPIDEKIPLALNMKSGHTYFVGNILKDLNSNIWSPVIVDVTSLEIIFPTEQPW